MEGVGVPVINATASATVDQVFSELYNGGVLPSVEEVVFTLCAHMIRCYHTLCRCWMVWGWVQMVLQFLHLISSLWSHILSNGDHETMLVVTLNLWPALLMIRKFTEMLSCKTPFDHITAMLVFLRMCLSQYQKLSSLRPQNLIKLQP